MSGHTIGIVGGGQLGRMLAMAAARLGFATIILEPQEKCPAAQVAGSQITADYGDADALDTLAVLSDVITYEFENVPVETARRLAARKPVYPPPAALEISQDRLLEKRFLKECGVATADFVAIDSQREIDEALENFAGKAVLKTRRLGYDGKGQRFFNAQSSNASGAHAALGGVPLILERLVPFTDEISVIAARAMDGTIVSYDPSRNHHSEGILRRSVVPSGVAQASIDAARAATETILARLDYVGVIGVEFFVLDNGEVLVNEFAPRVHNSGHWTEAACTVSQFEQHVRAICNLPLADCTRHSDCEMDNLIGSDVDNLKTYLSQPDTLVHLYGKLEIRPGRKMGHVTRLNGPAKQAGGG
ncbi:5-(carboxyamino)imidazole ribonucleotide synthase [Hoeflea prorocentri]|uniref:N5-carboxyaminoimidazole ribonucleotide synthase n=1 Tax=Hoeflea prorocentri TaxID=1922333 RepID=A0A9X3ZF45_9HYPH|nr:5-(carboxyamino)imidazole ribonucleotide synthase [Hoeflea prorocentri]MCY6379271.1 5-(carboxyamino)imidazole ribonucleotide synthase [Hoeflea prorocentri]MDA5397072.1 5-(carboxyamino)imidazole ribonucleotide synthase [Hoeflea prorocentri]